VQFDLRFYVVALLFIIFDVEVAFFFPWATVYGKAIHLLDPRVATEHRRAASPEDVAALGLSSTEKDLYRELGVPLAAMPQTQAGVKSTAQAVARVSILDISAFFAVLLVGFAYVWKRGDLDWVRAVARDRGARGPRGPDVELEEPAVLSM
jgi:NADH-quinone oxidoreductase subunit A